MTKELLNKIENLDKIIRDTIKDTNDKNIPVLDGIVNITKYFSSKYKILWILKEPNDTNGVDGIIGNWDMRKFISEEITDYKDWKKTYALIIYTTYGILNDFPKWDKVPDIDDDSELKKILHNIAYINLKKIPGGSESIDREIFESYSKYKNIIKKQIELYNPDIILCAGTFHIIAEDFNLRPSDSYSHIVGNKIFIDTYHPNQRTITHNEYYTEAIEGIKNCIERIKTETDKIVDRLDCIYYYRQLKYPHAFDNSLWEEFENVIIDAKKLGIKFTPLTNGSERLNFLSNEDRENITELYKYNSEIKGYAEQDKILSATKEGKEFVDFYIKLNKHRIDWQLADTINHLYFKKINEQEIEYNCGIDEIYDFKIDFLIKKHYK